jgi:hypothetical protein
MPIVAPGPPPSNRLAIVHPKLAVPPGFFRDAATIKRSPATADSAGNPTGALATVFTGNGLFSLAPFRKQGALNSTAQRKTQTEAYLMLPNAADCKAGDYAFVHAGVWRVIAVEDRTLYQAAKLEQTKA